MKTDSRFLGSRGFSPPSSSNQPRYDHNEKGAGPLVQYLTHWHPQGSTFGLFLLTVPQNLISASWQGISDIYFYFFFFFSPSVGLEVPLPHAPLREPERQGDLLNMRPLGDTFYPGTEDDRNTESCGRDGNSPLAASTRTAGCYISQQPVIQDLALSASVQRG